MLSASEIRNLRKMMGKTQEQFAELFGVSASAVGTWELEKAYPRGEIMIKLESLYKDKIGNELKVKEDPLDYGALAEEARNTIQDYFAEVLEEAREPIRRMFRDLEEDARERLKKTLYQAIFDEYMKIEEGKDND